MTLEKDSVRGEQPILSDKNISLKKSIFLFCKKKLLLLQQLLLNILLIALGDTKKILSWLSFIIRFKDEIRR